MKISDAGTGVAGYHLEHRLGSSGPWERLLNHTSQTGYNYTAVEGVHHFRVQAIDAVSHPSAWATTAITVDLNNPGLSLNAIAEASPNAYAAGDSLYYGPNGSGDFTISVDASDNLAGLAEIGFPTATSSGTTLQAGGVLNTTASHLYTFDSADTFDGPAQISATDRAGNTGSLTVNILRDEQGPAISLEAAPRGLFIDVSWQLSDAQTGLASCELAVQVDGGAWTPLSTACAGSLTYPGQANTTYRFRAQGTDNVNNTASQQTASITPDSVTKYYHHGDERVAMRQGGEVYYLYSDHLGSTSLTADETGTVVAEARYLPLGQERWSGGAAVTDFGFTGQRVDGYIKLIEMGARWYDPQLGHFISPDTLTPDYARPQSLNRFSYTYNNPVKYTDPSGHCPACIIVPLVVAGLFLANEMAVGEETPPPNEATVVSMGFTIGARGEGFGPIWHSTLDLVSNQSGQMIVYYTESRGIYFSDDDDRVVMATRTYLHEDYAGIKRQSESHMTPQLGFGVAVGHANGGDIDADVKRFEGIFVNTSEGTGYEFFGYTISGGVGLSDDGQTPNGVETQTEGFSVGFSPAPVSSADYLTDSKPYMRMDPIRLPSSLIPLCKGVGLCGGN